MNRYVNEELETILRNDKEVFNAMLEFIDFIMDYNSINSEDELLNMKTSKLASIINTSLQKYKMKEYQVLLLQKQINEHDELISRYINTFVPGDSCSVFEQGKTTGGPKDKPDSKHIKLLQMKEEQRIRIEKMDQLQIECNNKMLWIKRLIDDVLPVKQNHYKTILKLYYADGECQWKIARAIGMTPEYVNRARQCGLTVLANAVKIAIKFKKT